MLLGAHESVAGGPARAFDRADEDCCDAIQIFTKNRQWHDPPMDAETAKAFRVRRKLSKAGRAPVLAHDSYLINLASPKPEIRLRSIDSLAAEVERCHALGVERVVLHPGAHLGSGEETGIAAVADALQQVLDRTKDTEVTLLVENTAGQGSYLGGPFEQLGAILDAVDALVPIPSRARLGVCLDTCHAFVFGYDLSTQRGFSDAWKQLEAAVGIERVLAMHLNDSAAPLGSKRDRHARVGTGAIGLHPFWKLVNDKRLRDLPAVLETPPDGRDRAFQPQLELLRRLEGAKAP